MFTSEPPEFVDMDMRCDYMATMCGPLYTIIQTMSTDAAVEKLDWEQREKITMANGELTEALEAVAKAITDAGGTHPTEEVQSKTLIVVHMPMQALAILGVVLEQLNIETIKKITAGRADLILFAIRLTLALTAGRRIMLSLDDGLAKLGIHIKHGPDKVENTEPISLLTPEDKVELKNSNVDIAPPETKGKDLGDGEVHLS